MGGILVECMASYETETFAQAPSFMPSFVYILNEKT